MGPKHVYFQSKPEVMLPALEEPPKHQGYRNMAPNCTHFQSLQEGSSPAHPVTCYTGKRGSTRTEGAHRSVNTPPWSIEPQRTPRDMRPDAGPQEGKQCSGRKWGSRKWKKMRWCNFSVNYFKMVLFSLLQWAVSKCHILPTLKCREPESNY